MPRRKPKTRKRRRNEMDDTGSEINEVEETQDDQDFYDDNTPFTAETLRAENARIAKETAEDDEAEAQRLEKALDSQGKFKSLAAANEYYGEQPANLIGGPRAEDYSADDQQQFEEDVIAFYESGGQHLANGLLPYPDDKHGPKRRSLLADVNSYRAKELEAKDRGDHEGEDRNRFFGRKAREEYEALPEHPAIKYHREVKSQSRKALLSKAHGEDSGESYWKRTRINEDAGTMAAEEIVEGEGDFWIPKEKSPHGDVEAYTPETALHFKGLPENVLRQIRQNIINQQAGGPDAIFRAVWQTLHKLGYADHGKSGPAAPAPKKPKSKKKDSGYRKGLSQAEFEKMRKAQGASRF